MKADPGIPGLQQAQHFGLEPGQLRIVDDHGVIVDHQMDIVAAQALPLHVINQLVAVHGVLPAVHLHMEAGKALAGAIVMDHQVVIAQNLGLGHDVVHDLLPQFRVRVLAQQGGDGVLCQIPAAVQNEQGHAQTNPAVHGNAGPFFNQSRYQNGTGGDAVVAAVRGGGKERGGVDALGQIPVKQVHPEFHRNGSDQHQCRRQSEADRGGVENLIHRGFHQLHADDHDQCRHTQAAQVFRPGVTVGVIRVGGLIRHPEADKGDDGTGGVGQVVHSVGGDGNRPGEGAHQKLEGKQQHVAHDAHQPRHGSNGRADLGAVRILRILYKQAKQQFCHDFPPKAKFFGTLLPVESQILRRVGRFLPGKARLSHRDIV